MRVDEGRRVGDKRLEQLARALGLAKSKVRRRDVLTNERVVWLQRLGALQIAHGLVIALIDAVEGAELLSGLEAVRVVLQLAAERPHRRFPVTHPELHPAVRGLQRRQVAD